MRRCIPILLSCACAPAPPVPLDVPGGPPVIALDQAAMSVSLPRSPVPADAARDGRFTLDSWAPAPESAPPNLRGQWAVTLPFPTLDKDRFLATDLVLEVGGERIPYKPNPHAAGRSWRLHAGRLYLSWPDQARPPAAQLTNARLAARLQRLEPDRSGLSPLDFVHYTATLDGDTREGLVLPADASLTWNLTLPTGARLDASTTALRPGPGRSDGFTLRVEVLDDSGLHVAGERSVAPEAAAFDDWRVDLSSWGGQQVELRLRVDSGPTTDWDFAFVAHPAVVGGAAERPPRRVVWIGLDTTRPDHLGLYGYRRDTSPNLDAWAASATVFDDALAPAPRTRPSFRAALTGRRPLDAVGAPTVLATLDAAGFATAGIAANVHLNRRFGFTRGADRWWLDPQAKADTQVDRAIAWLDQVADRDAALFLHIMDPHLAYDAPEPYRERFVTDADPTLPRRFTRSRVLGWQRAGLSDRRKAHIEARYDGEIAATDAQLARLFAHLDTLPGRTLVVLHSDHGEEFWEHGGFEHNHTLKPEVVDAVALIRTPGQAEGRRIPDPVTLADLKPTVLDLLGVDPPPTDGVSLRPLLDGGTLPPRPLDVGHLMYDRERWGVRVDGHTYVLYTATGEEQLYERSADPGEHTDLVERGADPTPFREALAQAHGIDVGPGWRAWVALTGAPLTWRLPFPALAAGVIDPESARSRRANLVWGERAPVLPDDVARVRLSEDGRTLTLTPGAHGEGIVWLRFAEPRSPAGRITALDSTVDVMGGPQAGVPGTRAFDVRSGTVIVPTAGEAARMQANRMELGGIDAATEALLKDLGYLER